MTETISIDDLTFFIKRSTRRKTIGLTVERDRSLVAHLPQHVDLDQAAALIRRRLAWVHQKLAEHVSTGPDGVFRRPEFVDGEGFYFLGRHYRLKLVDKQQNSSRLPTVRFEGDHLLLQREQIPAGGKRIAQYYTRAAYPYLRDVISKWKKVVGVNPARFIRVLDLGYRWASCSDDGTLNFHWRIMQLAPDIIDYVVVHELAHLKVSDHSPAFWSEVERVLPDYARRRARLREIGGRL